MEEISLTGTMRCEPDEVAAVAEAMDEHIRLSRRERGCLVFDLWQDANDPCVFHVSERFSDDASFQAHQRRTRSSDWWALTRHMARDFRKTQP